MTQKIEGEAERKVSGDCGDVLRQFLSRRESLSRGMGRRDLLPLPPLSRQQQQSGRAAAADQSARIIYES